MIKLKSPASFIWTLRFPAFSLSIVSHFTALLLFRLFYTNNEFGNRFFAQFYTLIIFSGIVSFLLFSAKETSSKIVLLLLRYTFLFLIGYPMGEYIGIELVLYSTLIIEISFYLSSPGNLILQIIIFISFILTQGNLSAWTKDVPGVSFHNLLASALYSFLIIIVSMMLKKSFELNFEKTKKIDHLNSAITQLTDANIGFQSYVNNLEIQTLIEERKRVSREIHDTVGYALTNIIMMMEAAALLPNEERSKRNDILFTARDQAQKGLEETRAALRHLRNEKPVKAYGINMIGELVSVFQQATGIDIRVEYGNLPGFTNDRIDAIIFRTIQEGMTNSFRHGMATVIRINFWIFEGNLHLSIHDNGVGSNQIVEGIGVAGMRERIADIGGHLDVKNVDDGFKIDADIPLEYKNGPN